MRAICGSSRAAACRSSVRAISITSVAENSEIKHTVKAFFSSTRIASLNATFGRNHQVRQAFQPDRSG
jgi:hypothetical protein